MRLWLIAAVLSVVACQQQAKPPAKPAELAFDGADANDSAGVRAHGERLTWVLGCRGCHGEKLRGHRFYERWARNLTRYAPAHKKTELIQVLRQGGEPGEELWGMPSEIFQHLSEPDMAALIAHLRSLKPSGEPDRPPLPWTQEGKDEIASGHLKPAAAFVRELKDVTPVDLGPQYALGRYITMVTCAECHGPKLEGDRDFTPNLTVAGAYTQAEFERLMTQGVPAGGRKLKNPLMGEVARERFTHFTPRERAALYAYLKARAEAP